MIKKPSCTRKTSFHLSMYTIKVIITYVRKCIQIGENNSKTTNLLVDV